MKKVVSLILCAAMLMGMGITSFALEWKDNPEFTEPFASRATVFTSGNWSETTTNSGTVWSVSNAISHPTKTSQTLTATCEAFVPAQAYKLTFNARMNYAYKADGYGEVQFNGSGGAKYFFRIITSANGKVKYRLNRGGTTVGALSGEYPFAPTSGGSYLPYEITVDGGHIVIKVTESTLGTVTLYDYTDPSPYALGKVTFAAYYAGVSFNNMNVYYAQTAAYAIDNAAVAGGQVTADITKGTGDAIAFAAAYDGAGNLIGVSNSVALNAQTPLTSGVYAFSAPLAGDAVKVFVWGDMDDTVAPMCASATAQ